MARSSEFEEAASQEFDVFLGYNSKDADAVGRVEAIWQVIEDAGKRAWFDKKDSVAGRAGTDAMAEAIDAAKCAALFSGKQKFGVWQNAYEARLALTAAVERPGYRVFSVLLPGFDGEDELPKAFKIWTRVDLTREFQDNELSDHGRDLVLAAVQGVSLRDFTAESASTPGITKPVTERFRALLVGVSEYDDPELSGLHGPHNDIDAFEGVLQAAQMPYGSEWVVTKCLDTGHDAFRKALTSFFGPHADPEDTLLFYYSGHGLIRDGEAYLCAKDTEVRQPYFTSMPVRAVADNVRECPARKKVVVQDCCHAAPLAETANPYKRLRDGVSVVLGSRGPAEDAKIVSETSPFTTKLVSVLGDPGSFDQGMLTVDGLVSALRRRGEDPWTNGEAGDIVLIRGAAAEAPPQPERPPDIFVEVSPQSLPADRLPLLRQLAATLDGLLSVAREEDQIPTGVVRDTMRMLGRELARLALTGGQLETLESLARGDARPRPTMAMRFANREAQEALGDLPWEYLPLCPGDVEGFAAAADVMSAPPLAMKRVIWASGTKQSGRGAVQQVALFSSIKSPGPKPGHHPLAAATEKKLLDFGISTTLAPPATWQVFSGDKSAADVVILQAPISVDERDKLSVMFLPPPGDGKSVPADNVCRMLSHRGSLTWLFIETMAAASRDQSLRAVRMLAELLATKLERPVVGVCHSGAYANSLAENENATPFLAYLIHALNQEAPLETASHQAREQVITELAVDAAVVGIPVVVRPEPRGEAQAVSRPVARQR
jgi:hypothetical protein